MYNGNKLVSHFGTALPLLGNCPGRLDSHTQTAVLILDNDPSNLVSNSETAQPLMGNSSWSSFNEPVWRPYPF
jgi:hypothetical protein